MKEHKEKEKVQFEDRLVRLHVEFLKAIREVYPLALLSSLSIVIATFSQGEFISAQDYAIGAGVSFLMAFIFSLSFKLLPRRLRNWGLALLSYVSTGLGVLFLLFIVGKFASTVYIARVVFDLIPFGCFLVVMLVLSYKLSKLTVKPIMHACKIESVPTSYSKVLKMGHLIPSIFYIILNGLLMVNYIIARSEANYKLIGDFHLYSSLVLVFLLVLVPCLITLKIKGWKNANISRGNIARVTTMTSHSCSQKN